MAMTKQYDETGKTCALCKKKKPLPAFSVTSKGHPHSYCKPCLLLDAAERRKNDIDRYRATDRKAHPPEYQRKRRIEERDETYSHYGGACCCCGEDEYVFLTLDHVNNDGKEHRAKYKGQPMYSVARREGYPDYLQLLCYNCNLGRSRSGGVCPHQVTI